jgi:SHS2 domain-containing protein
VRKSTAGFKEHEHTADWELQVWAKNLPGLLEQAARGMYALSGARLQASPRIQRRLELSSQDAEGLLVAFLQELLYLGEMDGLGFDHFELQVEQGQLRARISGASLAWRDKEIKAATYHNLKIRQTEAGLEVNIVFDV